MRIEIRATYWCGDGSDDISVEMEFDGPTVGPMAMEQAVLPVLDRLITVASHWAEPLMRAKGGPSDAVRTFATMAHEAEERRSNAVSDEKSVVL